MFILNWLMYLLYAGKLKNNSKIPKDLSFKLWALGLKKDLKFNLAPISLRQNQIPHGLWKVQIFIGSGFQRFFDIIFDKRLSPERQPEKGNKTGL